MSAIHHAIRKYGIEAFEFTVIVHASSREELNSKEQHYIKLLNCRTPHGYNLTAGGDGVLDPAQEVIEKNRRAHLGRKASEETKAKMRASSRHLSPSMETLEALRLYRATRVISKETREKISAAQRGKKRGPLSQSTRDKIRLASIANNTGAIVEKAGRKTRFAKGQVPWNKGKSMSAEWVQKLVTSHLGKKQSEETRRKRRESFAQRKALGLPIGRPARATVSLQESLPLSDSIQ